jgi:hypothetical protein
MLVMLVGTCVRRVRSLPDKGLSKRRGRQVLLSSNVHGNNSGLQCVVLPDTKELVLVPIKRGHRKYGTCISTPQELPFQSPIFHDESSIEERVEHDDDNDDGDTHNSENRADDGPCGEHI